MNADPTAGADARSGGGDEGCRPLTPIAADGAVSDALLAFASLSRAIDGRARLSDVGSLVWMLLRQVVPGDAMALFLLDDEQDEVVIRYAAGLHAPSLRGVTRPTGTGVAGWAAANRRSVLNGDPALDLGFRAESAPALRSCVVAPLLDTDTLVAVLAIYSTRPDAFGEDHARLLEVLGPNLAATLVDAVITDHDNAAAAPHLIAPLTLVQRG
ncbi:MAG TPA: GAF domain-containing protein [Vicinamibacterales bacterium]|jgi:GAF domain-containing protein|nr:GAF domain-containing protein [Vicinamibacterales bacterium]